VPKVIELVKGRERFQYKFATSNASLSTIPTPPCQVIFPLSPYFLSCTLGAKLMPIQGLA
jgi:hypothetical protein